MIEHYEILILHRIAIEEFGGSTGIRDEGLLKSALARPFQTFDGEELYPSLEEKACALLESIVKNHPFVDGNKRTGYMAFRLFLMNGGNDIEATQDEKYEFVMDIASGKLEQKDILMWTRARLRTQS